MFLTIARKKRSFLFNYLFRHKIDQALYVIAVLT